MPKVSLSRFFFWSFKFLWSPCVLSSRRYQPFFGNWSQLKLQIFIALSFCFFSFPLTFGEGTCPKTPMSLSLEKAPATEVLIGIFKTLSRQIYLGLPLHINPNVCILNLNSSKSSVQYCSAKFHHYQNFVWGWYWSHVKHGVSTLFIFFR